MVGAFAEVRGVELIEWFVEALNVYDCFARLHDYNEKGGRRQAKLCERREVGQTKLCERMERGDRRNYEREKSEATGEIM